MIGCNQNEVIKTHGIAYLEKREKLIIVNETNKNDTISILGQPSTKGMVEDNLWIYIERTITRGKLLKLGKNYIKKNNVLVIEFDKYGIAKIVFQRFTVFLVPARKHQMGSFRRKSFGNGFSHSACCASDYANLVL